jgi:hypothetical protein
MKKYTLYILMVSVIALVGCKRKRAKVVLSTTTTEHSHVQMLLDNAFKYIDPAHGLTDSVSGYPVEGWNEDPEQGLFLRSFTQLTAIGEWVELLANIASGQADNPYIPQDNALVSLTKVVDSLLIDQDDILVSSDGLLVNFLGFENGKRVGPLTSHILKITFLKSFGEVQGNGIWKALEEKGWIVPEKDGTEAAVKRSSEYGDKYFNGPLEDYSDDNTIKKIMGILDERVVTIIFGDNVNLTASMAKGIGALLYPSVRDNANIVKLRERMEQFIENQRAGYNHLYDTATGSFVFGWNASEDRFVGWEIDDGSWVVGRMNYFINEFRGGWIFAVLRYGLSEAAIGSGSFKIKPYQLSDGSELYVPAAWDGSAFQMLGLTLFMQEMELPSWRMLLKNAVNVEVDFSTRHTLPGFLSESYSGNENEYTGSVGIPQIAVTEEPRITDAPSLYTLGVAYQIEPELIENFLAEHWSIISTLFTDHGPWEGYNTTTKSPIKFQTTAHTISLILGILGTGHNNMKRYLVDADLQDDLLMLGKSGPRIDLLSDSFDIFAWSNVTGQVQISRDKEQCIIQGKSVGSAYFAVVAKDPATVNLSGQTLRLRYKSADAIDKCILELKASGKEGNKAIKNEIFISLPATGAEAGEAEIPLPVTPALSAVHELVFMLGETNLIQALDLRIIRLDSK